MHDRPEFQHSHEIANLVGPKPVFLAFFDEIEKATGATGKTAGENQVFSMVNRIAGSAQNFAHTKLRSRGFLVKEEP